MTAHTHPRRARLLMHCRVVLLALGAQIGLLHAQAIPGSGELLQQTPRPATAAPSSNTGLTIQEPTPRRLDDTTMFLVQHIEIIGNTLLPTSELRSLVSSSEGKRLNFSNLEQLATLITRRYQDRGYVLSRAYIPPQTIKESTVRIAVLEARYGAVSLSNTSEVSDALLNSYFAPLRPGQPVTEGPLERSLLLASDVPGAVVNSTLAPGAAPGTSELKVSAAPGEAYGGYAALDDAGNRYTGRTRASGTFDLNDPLHQGDVLSATGLTAGADFTYGRLGYQALLDDGAGTSLGGALSGLYYHLGDGASDLHAHGTAQVATVSLMQPFIRSTEGNLYLQIGVDRKLLRDEIDTSGIHSDRDTTDLTVTLAADRRDAGGISNINLGLGVGDLAVRERRSPERRCSGRENPGLLRHAHVVARSPAGLEPVELPVSRVQWSVGRQEPRFLGTVLPRRTEQRACL